MKNYQNSPIRLDRALIDQLLKESKDEYDIFYKAAEEIIRLAHIIEVLTDENEDLCENCEGD